MGTDQIRLLIVEDVQQVATYIRGLLNAQKQIQLVGVLSDGSKVVAQAQQMRPDVVLVDHLLQGRTKSSSVVEGLHQIGVPVILLTVPQNPVEPDPARGIHAVLKMPFSGYDLINVVQAVQRETAAATHGGAARFISIYAPKGGVGKTTIALNFAVAAGQLGSRTALVDGSLQFGDLRALLKVPNDAPSILDLPTDRIQESDLADVLWRDPSGIDILLAPPRIEMAEMLTVRDVEKIVGLLRRVYDAIVVDLPSALTDMTLSFLDNADTVLEIVTFDSTTIHNTLAMADTFRSIGYAPSKVRYVVNRADSSGGISPEDLARVLGRVPEHTIVSDGLLVVQSNNEGVPFVLANPEAPVSQDVTRIAAAVLGSGRMAATGRH